MLPSPVLTSIIYNYHAMHIEALWEGAYSSAQHAVFIQRHNRRPSRIHLVSASRCFFKTLLIWYRNC